VVILGTTSSKRSKKDKIQEKLAAEDRNNGAPAMVLRVLRDEKAAALPLPTYATPFSSGMDLRAAEEALLLPGEWAPVGTGLSVEIPEGFEGQVRPRSGLALKHGVTVLNAPGTIDADYRGEVRVLLVNHSRDPFTVEKGDRIAQLVITPVVRIVWEETDVLESSERGSGGFGSTGR
jgi:dUTP pyrophosphatase